LGSVISPLDSTSDSADETAVAGEKEEEDEDENEEEEEDEKDGCIDFRLLVRLARALGTVDARFDDLADFLADFSDASGLVSRAGKDVPPTAVPSGVEDLGLLDLVDATRVRLLEVGAKGCASDVEDKASRSRRAFNTSSRRWRSSSHSCAGVLASNALSWF
jgi:hypothetical protein